MGYDLGVDLGTTFVAAAEIVTLGDRAAPLPAVVAVRADGGPLTGEAAARRVVSSPDRIGREFTRWLDDPAPVALGGREYSFAALLALLLRDVVAKVTEVEGEPPGRVALTHPAHWTPERRTLLSEVGSLAGLSAVTLVAEPDALAAHYAATGRLADGQIVASYDLGGGIFETAVLRGRPDGVELLGAPAGIDRLGGVDFDEVILRHVELVSSATSSALDLADSRTRMALARLRQDCVAAKEALSLDQETVVPVFLPGRHIDVPLSRDEFEAMIRPSIAATMGALGRALRSARVTPEQLGAVLLLGGSARIPLVPRMLAEEFGRPTVVGPHPKHPVALGAALLAAGVAAPLAPATPASPPAGPPAIPAAPPAPPPPAAPPPKTPSPQAAPTTPPARPAPKPSPAVRAAPARPRPAGPPTDPNSWLVEPPPHRPATGRPAGFAALVLVTAVVLVFGTWYVFRSPRSGPSAAPAPTTTTTTAAPGATATSAAPALPPSAPPAVLPGVPAPTLGAPIAVGPTPEFVTLTPGGRLAYVANGNAKTVTVLDTSVNRVIATIPVPAGPPQFLTFAPDGRRVYLSIFDDAHTVAAVAVLDAADNQIVATIPVRTRPFRAAVTPDGHLLYVPNHDSGTISVIDTTTLKVVEELPVPPNPHWIEFSHDGTHAYTADHESNLIAVLDTTTGAVTATIPVGRSPHALAVHPTRPLLAGVNYDANTVTMIDTATNTVTATIPVGKNPQAVTWSADGRFAYAVNDGDDTISVIDADTNHVTATLPTGPSPTNIAVLPDNHQAYVTNLDAGTLTVFNPAG